MNRERLQSHSPIQQVEVEVGDSIREREGGFISKPFPNTGKVVPMCFRIAVIIQAQAGDTYVLCGKSRHSVSRAWATSFPKQSHRRAGRERQIALSDFLRVTRR
jgi:hypothetical protein